jgi:hypothetical protein
VTTTSCTSPRKPDDELADDPVGLADAAADFFATGGADAGAGAAAVAVSVWDEVGVVDVCANAVLSAKMALMARAVTVRPGSLARCFPDLKCKFPFCVTDMFCS